MPLFQENGPPLRQLVDQKILLQKEETFTLDISELKKITLTLWDVLRDRSKLVTAMGLDS